MFFHTAAFLVFFPIVLLVHYVLPSKMRCAWLLLASYFFYMCWNPIYAVLLLAVTGISYACGLLLAGADVQKKKRLLVALSVTAILGMLAVFKYTPFLTENINLLLGAMGMEARIPKFDILMPVGISFYSFQALGYVMDVYKGRIKAERNWIHYALFVSFFPQLSAGPIGRAPDLLPQIHAPRAFDFDRVRKGLLLMLWGIFQKLVIADRVAILVNTVYSDPLNHVGLTFVVATLFFAVQIYCDFSGYSDVAIGAAQVLGFDFRPNFRQPYLAISISDFWRRWHISLSTWFRDYVYAPLSGHFVKKRWKLGAIYIVSSLVVWGLTGLWHGASWSYVVWGGLNGIFLIAERQLTSAAKKIKGKLSLADEKQPTFSSRLLKGIVTFALINLTWVFFRAPNIKTAFVVIERAFAVFNPWVLLDGSLYVLGIAEKEFRAVLLAIALLLAVDIAHEHGFSFRDKLLGQQLWFRWLMYLCLIFAVLLLGVYGPQMSEAAFIYSQF